MTNKPTATFTIHAIEKIFKGKFSSATNIQLLWKGNESFQTIFDAIKNAEKLICLEFYIFRNDETGTDLSELLKQKSLEGVKVYLLYDHFGSFGTPKRFWKDMKKAGIKIRASRPFKWTSPFNYVHRDHRKLIVIDNKKAFTGGLNIANEYSGFHLRTKGRGWRDTGIMLEGPIVDELFKAFKKWWYIWGGEIIENSKFEIRNSNLKEGIPAIPIFAASAKGRRRMRRLLYYSINHSQKSVTLTTAYFTPSRRMVEILENAVNRGVSVRLLVPGISDVPAASYAGKAFFSRLLKAEKLLDELGLYARKDHKPGELSGGEQQRVAVARALLLDPKVVLADEPTGNLDAATGEDLFRLLMDINQDHGITFIIVTHNESLSRRCHRILEMVDGKLHGKMSI